jgi:hypothetical protein
MPILIGQRLSGFTTPGSMGVVRDTTFIRCYWPTLTEPMKLFAPGSNQISVIGPPTPRNIVFPGGTQFPNYLPDAHAAGVAAIEALGRRIVNLSPEEVAIYMAAHDAVAAELPVTATRVTARSDRMFLVNLNNGNRLIADLTMNEAISLCDGLVTRAALALGKVFHNKSVL